MKIMFVVKSKAIETLGCMYLSAIAKANGHESRIVELENATIVASVWQPDIVGMSVLTGNQDDFISLAETLKLVVPSCRIIVGSHHATFFPQDFNGKDFDCVVQGEAENWMSEFLGSDTRYPNLDSLPFPNREDFPDMPIRDFITSRGCIYGTCRYCYNDRWNKMFPDMPKVRFRSVDNVIEEIESVKGKFNYFQDSCFGVSMSWLKDFSNKYREKIDTPFHCHLRPSQVTEERIKLLWRANCHSVRIALETGSDRLRKVIGREKTSNQEAIDAANILAKYGIKLMVQNMLSLSESTIQDDLLTLKVNIECKPAYAWASIFAPYPGTDLGDECKERGYYTGDYSDITDSFFDMSVLNFSDEYKMQTYLLQKVFALAVEAQCMPEIEDLTYDNIYKFIHKAMRKIGDGRMYNNVLQN